MGLGNQREVSLSSLQRQTQSQQGDQERNHEEHRHSLKEEERLKKNRKDVDSVVDFGGAVEKRCLVLHI